MKEYNLPRGAACLSSRRPQIGARPFASCGYSAGIVPSSGQKSAKPIRAPFYYLIGPSSPGTGSCREKPFGLYGSVEIVGGEYGIPDKHYIPMRLRDWFAPVTVIAL